jgi:hypothetical protein
MIRREGPPSLWLWETYMTQARSDGNVPQKYRSLLRRLQRGRWARAELEWLQRHHPDLPPLVASVVREKLAQLGKG